MSIFNILNNDILADELHQDDVAMEAMLYTMDETVEQLGKISACQDILDTAMESYNSAGYSQESYDGLKASVTEALGHVGLADKNPGMFPEHFLSFEAQTATNLQKNVAAKHAQLSDRLKSVWGWVNDATDKAEDKLVAKVSKDKDVSKDDAKKAVKRAEDISDDIEVSSLLSLDVSAIQSQIAKAKGLAMAGKSITKEDFPKLLDPKLEKVKIDHRAVMNRIRAATKALEEAQMELGTHMVGRTATPLLSAISKHVALLRKSYQASIRNVAVQVDEISKAA